MSFQQYFQHALRLHHAQQLPEAKVAYQQYLSLNPLDIDALVNLASVLRRLGETEQALATFKQAQQLEPDCYSLHYNLANLYAEQRQWLLAIESYQQSLSLTNDVDEIAQSAYNLALTFVQLGQQEKAIASYQQAIQAQPHHIDAQLNLATLYGTLGRLSEAKEIFETLSLQVPHDARVINNLAGIYQDAGQSQQAISTYDKSIALQNDLPQPRSNRLMALQYHPNLTASQLLTAATDWGHWANQRAQKLLDKTPSKVFSLPVHNRPLRIAYMSADLCMHPVGLFLSHIIALHDPSQITPIIYSNGSVRDHITIDIITHAQQKGGGYRDVSQYDDITLCQQIKADKIDILVDLSGHTGKTRLSMFALRPAPVQISWLGYFATTGLSAIDYVLLDPYHAPAGAESQFSEQIVRLPNNRFCYQPMPFAPAVSAAPCLSNGYITFGSFNNTAKLNKTVLTLWATLLQQLANSRLILKWRTFADISYQHTLYDFFEQQGIARDRIELRTASVHKELLEQYADIDIALDPFPFSGGHTSCESLWMGVPIITLVQERIVSRQTYSFLANIGKTHWAATTEADYLSFALELASDYQALNRERQTLRQCMAQSPLCDVQGFTQSLEQAYRHCWNQQRRSIALALAKQGMQLREDKSQQATRLTAYRQAVSLLPEEGLLSANLASALCEQALFDEAVEIAQQAINLSPQRFEPWFNIGLAYAGLKQETKATHAFNQAIENLVAEPEQANTAMLATVYQHLGDTLTRSRQYIQASKAYEQALTTLGKSPSQQREYILTAFEDVLHELGQLPPA